MKEKGESKTTDILPVPRSKDEAKRFYDHISRFYDCFTGVFERKYAERALKRLCIEEGETVLEVGFGTGHCLKRMAELVGKTGKVYGIDISPGMLEITRNKRVNSNKNVTRARSFTHLGMLPGNASSLYSIKVDFLP